VALLPPLLEPFVVARLIPRVVAPLLGAADELVSPLLSLRNDTVGLLLCIRFEPGRLLAQVAQIQHDRVAAGPLRVLSFDQGHWLFAVG